MSWAILLTLREGAGVLQVVGGSWQSVGVGGGWLSVGVGGGWLSVVVAATAGGGEVFGMQVREMLSRIRMLAH